MRPRRRRPELRALLVTALRFVRWVGGPGGHREFVGTARLHRDGHVSVDAALIPFVTEARLDIFTDL